MASVTIRRHETTRGNTTTDMGDRREWWLSNVFSAGVCASGTMGDFPTRMNGLTGVIDTRTIPGYNIKYGNS